MPCNVTRAKALIRAQINQSPVPEDPGHAQNTLAWLLRLAPNADPALRIAALAHDIERARPDRLRRQQFADYDYFKALHAAIGARMAGRLLRKAGVTSKVRSEACRLIRLHEFGGDARSDLLKDADSISFFDHNLPLYLKREGMAESLRRARWGYARLSARGRHHVSCLIHSNPDVMRIVEKL